MYQVLFAPKIRHDIAQIGQLDSWAAAPLALALRDTFDGTISAQEQVWIDKIEALREAISRSTQEVTITAYGAGSPEMNLSEAEMYEGRIVKRSVGETARGCSQKQRYAILLLKLVHAFKSEMCVELGTCLGVSGAYQAAGQKLHGGDGRLVTMEGAASLATLAGQHFAQLGLDNASVVVGRFSDRLPDVLAANQPIDYAYIDGHHDEKATIDYFEQFLPYLADRALLVFDDIGWSDGMRRAWQMIENHDRVRLAVNLRRIGLAVVDDTIKEKHRFQVIL